MGSLSDHVHSAFANAVSANSLAARRAARSSRAQTVMSIVRGRVMVGRAIAIALARAGAHVAVLARSRGELEETVRLIEAGSARR